MSGHPNDPMVRPLGPTLDQIVRAVLDRPVLTNARPRINRDEWVAVIKGKPA